MISYQDVAELLSLGGESQLTDWRASPELKQFVRGFEHSYWQRVTLAEVESVKTYNEARLHPLGRIRASAAIRQIDDFAPDFPLAVMFHACLEDSLKVPTWEEYFAFLTSPAQRARCYAPFEQELARLPIWYTSEQKAQALQWRLGNAYSSCLRELWFAAVLRERYALFYKYHLLADIQLQTDLWRNGVLVGLRVPSDKLRRKRTPRCWTAELPVVNLNIGHGGNGKLWLPSEDQLQTFVGLRPEPGTTTTIYPDGTVTVDSPRGPRPPAAAAMDLPTAVAGMEEAVHALGLPARPRYSLTVVTRAPVAIEQVAALLRAGIKVILFQPEPPTWPELSPFQKARLLQILPLPADLYPEVSAPCVVTDGQTSAADLALLGRLGQEVALFNFEQWQVEHASATDHLQVSAGAGTGKTAVMKDRVMFLLHTVDGLTLREITMITFTREATRVMRERLRRELEARFRLTGDARYLTWLEDLSFMQVSTIPSFARRLLQAVGSLLGYGQNFRIREFGRVRETLLGQILDEMLQQARQGRRLQELLRVPLYQFVDVANRYWHEMENKGLGPNEIKALDWGTAKDPACLVIQQIWPELFQEAERRLQAEKERSNSISLADLTRQIQIIGSHLDGLARSGFAIKYLFVDEFQDSDETQIRLVAALQKELGARIFVVGDVKQSIYRFRGATHTAFDSLKSHLEESGTGVTVFTLRKNYRTSKAVLDQIAPFFERWGDQGWLPYTAAEGLVSVVEDVGELRIEPCDAKDDADALRQRVMALIREAGDTAEAGGPEPQRMAVLVRTNEQAALIKRWCDEDPSGIFCQVDRGGTLFASKAAHDFHSLVAGLLYPDDPVALLNLLATPFSAARIPWPALLPLKGDTDRLRAYLDDEDRYPCTGWRNLTDRCRTEPVLSVLRRAIREMHPTQRYYNQELADLKAQFPGRDSAALEQEAGARAAQYQLNLDRIMELIHSAMDEEFATLYGVHAWLDVQQATNRTESEPPLPQEEQTGRILCVTVHRSKGDEFHTVIVPFTYKRFRVPGSELLLEERNGKWSAGWMLQVYVRYPEEGRIQYRNDHHRRLQQAESSEAFMEETRLFYVALTRTQRRLWIVQYPKGNENWGRLLRLND